MRITAEPLTGTRVLITGNSGALARAVFCRLLHLDRPRELRPHPNISFISGLDIPDLATARAILRDVDILINTTSLCPAPLFRAIRDHDLPVVVAGVSSARIPEPEPPLPQAGARFVAVRLPPVLGSPASPVSRIQTQIRQGGPVTIPSLGATRFLLAPGQAADTLLTAVQVAEAGEIVVPVCPAARVQDIATALIGGRDIPVTFAPPDTPLHDILITGEEAVRTVTRPGFGGAGYYVIRPQDRTDPPAIRGSYTSACPVLPPDAVRTLLQEYPPGECP